MLKINKNLKKAQVLLGLAIGAHGLGVCQDYQQAPNILWLVSEDNSPYLGCYGDSVAQTPNLDALAAEGVVFDNAFANAPVCAPARSSLISGMYASALGTENMRSAYPIPESFRFFPQYLRDAGYYCTNNAKKDYNMPEPEGVWDESSRKAHYRNRKEGEPFFAVFNFNITHESRIHVQPEGLCVDPKDITLAPYHPDLPEIRKDYAVYYHRMKQLDDKLGEMIADLKESGEWENTIVFYYSDHGGVLPFSKRFIKDTGTKIPMIVRIPKRFQHLTSFSSGKRTDRIVNLVDLGPTILSLAGIQPPSNMHGKAFMGAYEEEPRKYSIGFRGRMDERFDLSRGIRSKRFHYIRNYMPNRIYGQHIEYLWKAASAKAWEAHYRAGKCNEIQSLFWQTKPVEELYDVVNDPHEIHNLANKEEYSKILNELREANRQHILQVKDAGFIPEGEIVNISKQMPVYEHIRKEDFPFGKIVETAEIASAGKKEDLVLLLTRIEDENCNVRFWAATGLVILKSQDCQTLAAFEKHLNDKSGDVRVIAAEGLYLAGQKEKAMQRIVKELTNGNGKVALRAANLLDILGKDAHPYKDEIAETAANTKDRNLKKVLDYWIVKHIKHESK